jgi:hypothetical protein
MLKRLFSKKQAGESDALGINAQASGSGASAQGPADGIPVDEVSKMLQVPRCCDFAIHVAMHRCPRQAGSSYQGTLFWQHTHMLLFDAGKFQVPIDAQVAR